MHPILVTILGRPIHFYQVFFPGTLLMGILLCTRRAKKEGFKEEHILAMFVFVILGLVLGARILDIIANFDWYIKKPSRFYNNQTGVVLLGGYLGSIGGGLVYMLYKKIPPLPIIDICATYFGLGLAIHRTFACFMAGCCYGMPTDLPWGVTYPVGSFADKVFGQVPVHPTQLYEAVLGLIIFFSVISYRNRHTDRVGGELFALQMLIYGIGRFFIEFVRGDANRGRFGFLTTSQWVSVGMIVAFVILTLYTKKKKRLKLQHS